MKQWITGLLAVVMLLGLCGCGAQKAQDDTVAGSYKQVAQGYIDAGNMDMAKAILEEGIAQTGDPVLQAMLDVLNAPKQPETTQPQQKDYALYAGTWGDLILTDHGQYMVVEYISYGGSGRLAEMSERVYYEQIVNDTVMIPYEDSWGNSGVMVLTFGLDTIDVEIKDVVEGYDALWGIYADRFTVRREEKQTEPTLEAICYEGFWVHDMAVLNVVEVDDGYDITISVGQDGMFCSIIVSKNNASGGGMTVPVEDDGFGGSGILRITYTDNGVYCAVEDLVDRTGNSILRHFNEVVMMPDYFGY